MKYIILITILILGGYYGFTHSRIPKVDKLAFRITNNTTYNGIKVGEIRKIESILAGSPAKAYAEDIYNSAVTYNMDYRIIIAIIRLESSYFKHTICNNGTGLGIYGTKKICFNSFKENIYETARHWATSSRFTKLASVIHKGCMWQQGRAVNCPYGIKLQRLVASL